MPKVLVYDVKADMRGRIQAIFDEFAPDLKGRQVLIKPNILAAAPPETGLNTHPAVVEAVVLECLQRGAEVLVGDNSGSIDRTPWHTAEMAGYLEACHGCFGGLSAEVVQVPSGSRYVKTFWLSKAVLEADYIINVPKLKAHVVMTITGALKNTLGYVPGGCKNQLHFKTMGRKQFAELLVDVHRLRPPDLNIMEALTVMEGNGPQVGPLRDVGKVLASPDAVALDATAVRMTGQDPSKVPLITIAQEKGLGVWEGDRIDVVGDFAVIPDFQKVTVGYWATEEAVKAFSELGKLKPVVFSNKCNPCDLCGLRCPVGAIGTIGSLRVDEEKCIGCFSCVEFCPRGAFEAPAGQAQAIMSKVFR
ncbi:MAG TPA: DUF362 domain-containing protein [Dehalococcoidia bacterium]|nr:DUF362 domain-containing protein [Dehalococcoidia bacterium]